MEKGLLYPVTNQFRQDQKLNGIWDFKFDPEAKGEAKGWTTGFDDPIKMPVPASFNDFFTDKDSPSIPEISGMLRSSLCQPIWTVKRFNCDLEQQPTGQPFM